MGLSQLNVHPEELLIATIHEVLWFQSSGIDDQTGLYFLAVFQLHFMGTNCGYSLP
jgi:hypothetical protein